MTDPRLPRLIALAEMHRMHALRELAAIDSEVARHRAAVRALRDTPSGPREGFADLALQRQADTWARWRDAQAIRHNSEALRLIAEREPHRIAAARATGRVEVLKKLAGST